MANFIYSTSEECKGPWLIDSDALLELDKIIDNASNALEKSNEISIQESIEKELLYYNFETPEELEQLREDIHKRIKAQTNFTKTLKIRLSPTKQIEIESFADALKENSLIEETPYGFTLEMYSQSENISLEVGEWNNKLKLRVSPESSDLSRTQFMNFRDWILKYQPPKWQQLWQNLDGLQWLLFFTLFIFASLALSVQIDSGLKSYTKHEAKELLKDGLQPDESLKALELILSREVSYNQAVQLNKSIPKWYIFLVITSFVMTIILSYPPENRLGIGKGITSIKLWRKYIRLISYTIPITIFTIIAVPIIQNYIIEWFKRSN